jgi:hypothetical protein
LASHRKISLAAQTDLPDTPKSCAFERVLKTRKKPIGLYSRLVAQRNLTPERRGSFPERSEMPILLTQRRREDIRQRWIPPMQRPETFALHDHNRTRVTALRWGNSGGSFDSAFCVFSFLTYA